MDIYFTFLQHKREILSIIDMFKMHMTCSHDEKEFEPKGSVTKEIKLSKNFRRIFLFQNFGPSWLGPVTGSHGPEGPGGPRHGPVGKEKETHVSMRTQGPHLLVIK